MIVNGPEFLNNFDSYVRTEELIVRSLIEMKNSISDDFEILAYPFAVMINNRGIQWTNDFISGISTEKRRIVVCQHIWAEHLSLRPQDILFTPHSTQNSSSISIGHQAVNFDTNLCLENRNIEFSFIGSLGTHVCRKLLKDLFPSCVFDSGVGWGLDKTVKEETKSKYIQLLGNSNFSLCPRGTGISSVRLFESLGMGCIPIIIADGYKPPLADLISWSDLAIFVPEKELSSIPDRIRDFKTKNPNLFSIREKIIKIFNQFFSDKNLHVPVALALGGNLD